MVQNKQSTRRPPGRPRGYSPEIAIGQALDLFWRNGFSATSLDDLSLATGMNRPSIYGAFGDKRSLYALAFRHYRSDVRERLVPLFLAKAPLRDKFRLILTELMEVYLSGLAGPRGCFTVMTAASDLVEDDAMRQILMDAITAQDRAFEQLFSSAIEEGELPASASPTALTAVATSTVYSLSVRARAGFAREDLVRLIGHAVSAIECNPSANK